jgi:hypothetical protein
VRTQQRQAFAEFAGGETSPNDGSKGICGSIWHYGPGELLHRNVAEKFFMKLMPWQNNEIIIRSTFFIQKCLSNDSHTTRSVANMAVFSLRMRSPLGRNAFICCSRYDLTLSSVFMVSRERVIRCVGRRVHCYTEGCLGV